MTQDTSMQDTSITVSLNSDGHLQMGLPAADGATRHISLRYGHEAETLIRVLRGLTALQGMIGEQGAPTKAQVKHWQSHQVVPDDRCTFCQEEQRLAAMAGALKRGHVASRHQRRDLGAGVVVQRIKTGARASKRIRTTKTAEDLGL